MRFSSPASPSPRPNLLSQPAPDLLRPGHVQRRRSLPHSLHEAVPLLRPSAADRAGVLARRRRCRHGVRVVGVDAKRRVALVVATSGKHAADFANGVSDETALRAGRGAEERDVMAKRGEEDRENVWERLEVRGRKSGLRKRKKKKVMTPSSRNATTKGGAGHGQQSKMPRALQLNTATRKQLRTCVTTRDKRRRIKGHRVSCNSGFPLTSCPYPFVLFRSTRQSLSAAFYYVEVGENETEKKNKTRQLSPPTTYRYEHHCKVTVDQRHQNEKPSLPRPPYHEAVAVLAPSRFLRGWSLSTAIGGRIKRRCRPREHSDCATREMHPSCTWS